MSGSELFYLIEKQVFHPKKRVQKNDNLDLKGTNKMKMMNQRQINILELFRNNKGVYITGALLAEEYGVSIRTIKNDINVINDYLVFKMMYVFHVPVRK